MNASKYKFSSYSKGGFTLIEALTALVIVGFICGTVLVVINDCVDSISDQSSRLEAIEVARENIEFLISQSMLKESVETGISEVYPGIEWVMSVEVVQFPMTNKLWMKAVSSANFYNSNNELEEIKFERWLAPLTAQQEKLIMNDRQREQDYLSELELEQQAEAQRQAELQEEMQQTEEQQQGQDLNGRNSLDIPGLDRMTGGGR